VNRWLLYDRYSAEPQAFSTTMDDPTDEEFMQAMRSQNIIMRGKMVLIAPVDDFYVVSEIDSGEELYTIESDEDY